MEVKLREILKLKEGEDIVGAVEALISKTEEQPELGARVQELETKLEASETNLQTVTDKVSGMDAQKIVDEALNAGKITAKQNEWAFGYVLKDPEGFKAFVEVAERVGPELKIIGGEGEGEGDAIKLTDMEAKIAKRMNVSEEKALEAKKAALAPEEAK